MEKVIYGANISHPYQGKREQSEPDVVPVIEILTEVSSGDAPGETSDPAPEVEAAPPDTANEGEADTPESEPTNTPNWRKKSRKKLPLAVKELPEQQEE
jgi:hypothetical protein